MASATRNPEPSTRNSSTIFALATPTQPSPVALIRVSGALVPAIASRLFGCDFERACLATSLSLPAGSVDAGVWVLPGPDTLTGEHTLEIRVPGSPTMVRQVEARLRDLGATDAEPGEFTRRALEAGKLDLSRAEAVLQLVTATDDVSRRQAIADLSGQTAERVSMLAERLRALSARYEMLFDFGEEEHADAEEERLAEDVKALIDDLATQLGVGDTAPSRERPVVALFGPPNAGKSTLFNALVGAPRALVSDVPGTTRDPVEAECKIGEQAALIADLSGVGHEDVDEGRFAERARERALGADVLLVLDAPGSPVGEEFALLEAQDASLRGRTLWVQTKADLGVHVEEQPTGMELVVVSAQSGSGINELKRRIALRLAQVASGRASSFLRLRAAEALSVLQAVAMLDTPPEAIASEVRRALRLLDEALLSEAPGDVLDLIFSRFCIGK